MYNSETKEFITFRNTKKHLLRKHNAWALDKKLVLDILLPDKGTIRIVDRSGKKDYRISVTKFVELSGEVDYHQHRPQLYLNIEKFEKIAYLP